jgi:DNA gyrase subunit B
LLLTFFYRQMPELIERGHIYIGLPPLFKIKQGKNELYLKDMSALNAYLVSNAVENAELVPAEGAPAIRGEALEKLMLQVVAAQDVMERFAYRIDTGVLQAILDNKALTAADFQIEGALTDWANALESKLNNQGAGKPRYRVNVQTASEEQQGALVIEKQHNGLKLIQTVAANQLLQGELRLVNETAQILHGLIQAGAIVQRGGKSLSISRFAEAQTWLLEEAKKGRTIQRFKGLGEMNPEQLWETTVNPESRRLLQVRIEDAVAADQIFSTLMGELVEPRRMFIEDNALKVGNLDI